MIIGKLIPAATGLKHYRTLAVEPAVAIEAPSEEGLLDEEELAAELGIDGTDAPVESFGPSFAEELEELAQEIESTSDESVIASRLVRMASSKVCVIGAGSSGIACVPGLERSRDRFRLL